MKELKPDSPRGQDALRLEVTILHELVAFTERPVTIIAAKEVTVVDFTTLRAIRRGMENIQ